MILIGLAAAGTLAVYVETLGYGFRYDDYHVVRPWTRLELTRVLHGTWDPTRVEVVFYRPLTAWWYALRFELFGLNAVPQHAVSLLGMAVCATLAGLFVWREIGSRRAAWIAAAMYAVHPFMAYSQAVWLTNQMHLLASVLVLVTMLAWQHARERGPWAWTPVLVLQILAFGTKEDTVMLVPLLLVLTGLRVLLCRDIRWPHWSILVAAAMVPPVLFGFRYNVLGRMGGYGTWPGPEVALQNLLRATSIFTIEPVRRPWQWTASATATSLLTVGAVCGVLRREPAYLLLVGGLTAAAFNLPFALVVKVEQYHLVTLGAVIALAAACEGILRLVPRRLTRPVAVLILLPVVSFVPLTRHMARDFAPCAASTLETDEIAAGWWMVPPEIQAWLRSKPGSCASGAATPLTQSIQTATWAFGPQPDEHGEMLQWTSRQATVMVESQAQRLLLALRRPGASVEAPVDVTISGPAATFTEHLSAANWKILTIPLPPGAGSRLGEMHRIDLAIAQTFVPAEFDRTSDDRRRLGVQLRVVGVE